MLFVENFKSFLYYFVCLRIDHIMKCNHSIDLISAPVAIRAHMVFPHAKITVYPSLREEMQFGGYHYLDDNVVVDGM